MVLHDGRVAGVGTVFWIVLLYPLVYLLDEEMTVANSESKWTYVLWTIILSLTALALLALMLRSAGAQSQTPPFCQGQNFALQFSPSGWVCTQIAGVIGPQGPQGEPGPPNCSPY
jgi:hypothetical protein